MSAFIVEGRRRLSGAIEVAGNKNEALPIIAAAMLCPHPVTIRNMPDIGDVRNMLTIARHLGASVSALDGGAVSIDAASISESTLPLELSATIRGSILFASALLARTGKAVLPQPGGDAIGRRRIDTHLLVFQALGARLHHKREHIGHKGERLTYILDAPKGLRGAEIYLDETSVTATENALIAAAAATGTTTIVNAASEPHVQGLCRFLQSAGAHIEGLGSNIVTVRGVGRHCVAEHTLGCDYIEAGSLIGLAASTGSELTITGVDPAAIRMILFQFGRLGVETSLDVKKRSVHIPSKQSLVMRKDLGGAIPRIEDSPWPGFPADLTSIMLVTATQCTGTCLIHEKMYESRLFFADKLIDMGAQIVLCDPHRAVVVGPAPLYGRTITSPDIRAGMALLIAALAAEGVSQIQNILQIDRGYERIDERLRAAGAGIERIADRRKS
jgi:UDP-N-acetylglucosamine 1-carboxyvinyltransferase